MMSQETLSRRRIPSPVWTGPVRKLVGLESILSFKSDSYKQELFAERNGSSLGLGVVNVEKNLTVGSGF